MAFKLLEKILYQILVKLRRNHPQRFRADGMAFVKVFASPMPHLKKIDLSKAKKAQVLAAMTQRMSSNLGTWAAVQL